MSTTGKTPISLLSETLVRQGIQPQYILQQSAVGVNQGEFIYDVIAGDVVTATGKGRSKKEAKQDAAKRALEILMSRRANEVIAVPTGAVPIVDPSVLLISPYETEMKGNQVGKLIDLCGQQNIPLPEFILIREDGPPHAKHFEFCVRVSAITETAVGRTKQQAKQLAAYNMLEALEKMNLVEISENSAGNRKPEVLKNLDAIFNRYKEAKSDKPLGLKIGAGLLNPCSEDQISFLQNFKIDLSVSSIDMLETICQTLALSFNVYEVPCASTNAYIVCLTLSTTPETSFLGMCTSGNNRKANDNAALKAIIYLKDMSH